jgi:branched-chain amino acid transport system ATP-binding protein
MLTVQNLEAGYGHIAALKGVDVTVSAGEFVAILGPNGAGKSTLMKAIIGVLRQQAGVILFGGERIDDLATAQRIRLGMGIIPEGRQLFFDMTVRENLILGAYAQLGVRIGPEIDTALEQVFTLFPRLAERQAQLAGSLSGGEAQMVAVGRALMSRPKLLLCDEPSLGLAPLLVRELLATLARLRDKGITILLADQNAQAALRIADRAYILDTGRVVASGASATLADDARLRAAYLGSGVETRSGER